MTIRRVAVSTGGGDCPGLNAVIRSLVKTGVRRYGWEFIGIEDGLTGLLQPNKLTDLTLAAVRGCRACPIGRLRPHGLSEGQEGWLTRRAP